MEKASARTLYRHFLNAAFDFRRVNGVCGNPLCGVHGFQKADSGVKRIQI